MSAPVLTSKRGSNADLFPDILRLYVPNGAVIADVTYGRGVFWRNVQRDRYHLLATDLSTGVDARHLPYDSESCDVVVFDPPYMHSGTNIKASLDKCYKNNNTSKNWKQVETLYVDAGEEARRVLKPNGILIAKTQDTVVNHKQCWMHVKLLSLSGYEAQDLFILTQTSHPLMSSKWKNGQFHARKNHSYFVVLRKL